MVTASFSIHNLEFFLLILTRVSTMISVAPFFNTKGIPNRTKIGLAFFLSILVALNMDYYDLEYASIIDYTLMVAKEAVTGLMLGVSGSIAMQTVAFAGHFIDIEIGFSMVQLFDPLTNEESSAFGTLYSYMIMLIMIASDMHYFIIDSLMDSFKLIDLGKSVFNPESIYTNVIQWATEYFMIGFRIILPCFAASLILNVVLGILARSAPQMNMFVIGMQLKVFVGFAILIVTISCITFMVDFVFTGMKDMIKDVLEMLTP